MILDGITYTNAMGLLLTLPATRKIESWGKILGIAFKIHQAWSFSTSCNEGKYILNNILGEAKQARKKIMNVLILHKDVSVLIISFNESTDV